MLRWICRLCEQVLQLIRDKKYDELRESDQLRREMAQKRAFVGFSEGDINFAPTYRMLKGRGGYSNKKNQNPSYTDRVVWRSAASCQSDVKNVEYTGTVGPVMPAVDAEAITLSVL